MTGPLRSAAVLVCVVACGGDKGPTEAPQTTAAPGDWREAAAGRTVVATVAGEPVYDDCVRDQAAAGGLTAPEALEECIDLELLAQEARRRGHAGDWEAVDARRREMVRKLIDEQFYAKFAKPADIPMSDVKQVWDRGLKNYFNRPENRVSFYCRAVNNDESGKTPVGGKAEADAKIVADEIYKRAKGLRNLEPESFLALCNQAAVDLKSIAQIASERFSFPRHGRAVEAFAAAAFAIPEIGRVAPPVRTVWGWDVILLIDILPERSSSMADAADEVRKMMFETKGFEGYRRERFRSWIDDLVASATIKRHDENLPPSVEVPTMSAPGPIEPGPGGRPPAGPVRPR